MAGAYRASSYNDDGTGFTGVATGGTATVALGTALTAGDLIVLGIQASGHTGPTPTFAVSDSVNGSWGSGEVATAAWVVVGLNTRTSFWAFPNSGSGTPTITVTITCTGGTNLFGGMMTAAFSGLATSSATDSTAATSGTSANPSSGAVSPSTGAAGEMMVGIYCDQGEGTTLAVGNIDGTAAILAGKHQSDSANWQGLLEYVDPAHTIGSGSTPSAVITAVANNGYGMLAGVFKLLPAGGSMPPGIPMMAPSVGVWTPTTTIATRGILASTPQPVGDNTMVAPPARRQPDDTSRVSAGIHASTPQPVGDNVNVSPPAPRQPDNYTTVWHGILASTPQPSGAQTLTPGAARLADMPFVVSGILASTPQPSGIQVVTPGVVRAPDNTSFVIPGLQVGIVLIQIPIGALVFTPGVVRQPDNTTFAAPGILASTPQPVGDNVMVAPPAPRQPDNYTTLVRAILAPTPQPSGIQVVTPGTVRLPDNTSFLIGGLLASTPQPAGKPLFAPGAARLADQPFFVGGIRASTPQPVGDNVMVAPGAQRGPDNTSFIVAGIHYPILAVVVPVVPTLPIIYAPLSPQLAAALGVLSPQVGSAAIPRTPPLGSAVQPTPPQLH